MDDSLAGRLVNRADLTAKQRQAMFDLLNTHFNGYVWDNFQRDLYQKNNVILLEDEGGVIRGFSTIQVLSEMVDSTPVRAIYSGDTIIEHAYWARNNLFQVWIPHVFDVKSQQPETPLYWFLLSSGPRTYKYLPTFFNDYYPRHDKPQDDRLKRIVDAFATSKFGEDYDANKGIIVFSHSQERLKPELAAVDDNQRRNPHVDFFLEKNPGYNKGNELACLTEISKANFKSSVLKRLSLL